LRFVEIGAYEAEQVSVEHLLLVLLCLFIFFCLGQSRKRSSISSQRNACITERFEEESGGIDALISAESR
jgi:hypothetical protein